MSLLDDRNGSLFILQSGLVDTQAPLTSDKTLFHSAQPSYQLASGQDTLDVTLDYAGADGLKAQQIYRFHRDSYQLDLSQSLVNSGSQRTVLPYTPLVLPNLTTDCSPRFS